LQQVERPAKLAIEVAEQHQLGGQSEPLPPGGVRVWRINAYPEHLGT